MWTVTPSELLYSSLHNYSLTPFCGMGSGHMRLYIEWDGIGVGYTVDGIVILPVSCKLMYKKISMWCGFWKVRVQTHLILDPWVVPMRLRIERTRQVAKIIWYFSMHLFLSQTLFSHEQLSHITGYNWSYKLCSAVNTFILSHAVIILHVSRVTS